ncbi:hypothetical protein, partial [Methylobrevis pamukkalensis]|uniref:hypothetical protein n=1 Tax=Methylobrevis pamukkalensis TaxID=1439726 RepID=UPI001AECEDE4
YAPFAGAGTKVQSHEDMTNFGATAAAAFFLGCELSGVSHDRPGLAHERGGWIRRRSGARALSFSR